MINTDILVAKWNLFRGKVKEQWSRITDYDLDQIEGKRDQLIGLVQEKYGYTKQKAEQEVEQFLKKLNLR